MEMLPKRKVLIKPIIREGKWLGKGHSGNFMYDNTKLYFTVPMSSSTGQLIDPLTKEEREFFENRAKSGMDFTPGDLSVYKKPNPREGFVPYWYGYQYMVLKNQGVVNEDTVLATLDLSKPEDYIAFKVLMVNSGNAGTVAPEWGKRFDQGTYRIVLVEEGYKVEELVSRSSKLGKAYRFFDTINKSQLKMYEFLSIYWLENRKASRPSEDSKIEWLTAEIQKLIDNDLETFLKMIETDYEEKLLIHNGMKCGAITRTGSTFVNIDGNPVGNSITEAILYYKDERHQEEKLKLLALIDN
jgi:hypothetical protein